ncbi:N-acyl amino acid synthase FeeM domain-containing protein [Aromatoleum diolicum]|uniref:Long-chain N-acyl amino acid synthase n=1 Tax=Aromatoleum diolicum TaxID=75796 RepID=A0ABX1QEP5_9RHOO|nr:long-chain N-acyl amino acid synthase [Aromatoleum diolicum]NMG75980.1 long-chain N-acyl amino acid synthase [Aromatoleum diolicum]
MNSVACHEEFRATEMSHKAAHKHTKAGRNHPAIDPGFAVTRNGFHIRVSPSDGPVRRNVDQLIQRMYASRGLSTSQPIAPPSPPPTLQTTLIASQGDRVFGTLTVGVDTGAGLLADTLYRPQIDVARGQGARVCEVTRLAMDPELNSQEALGAIFHLGFIIARFIHGMTDLFAEVHPRHVPYYRRMLGYRVAGPNLICPRVGAPAVLMHLPLSHAEQETLRHGGNKHSRDRSLYQRFFSPVEQGQILRQLNLEAA